jgi:hypothetical protein
MAAKGGSMRKALGVFFLLGMLACLGISYMGAGGQHGYSSFDARRMLRGDEVIFTLGAVACAMVAAAALFGGGKKKG